MVSSGSAITSTPVDAYEEHDGTHTCQVRRRMPLYLRLYSIGFSFSKGLLLQCPGSCKTMGELQAEAQKDSLGVEEHAKLGTKDWEDGRLRRSLSIVMQKACIPKAATARTPGHLSPIRENF